MTKVVETPVINSNLLDFLKSEGVVKETTAKTLREYDEPTIEFYKSGQARVRGIAGNKVGHLLYKVSSTGIKLYPMENSETLKAFNDYLKKQGMETLRVCETSEGKGDPNIRVGKKATDFFNYIKKTNPENCQENRAGSVAWDKLQYKKDEKSSQETYSWEMTEENTETE